MNGFSRIDFSTDLSDLNDFHGLIIHGLVGLNGFSRIYFSTDLSDLNDFHGLIIHGLVGLNGFSRINYPRIGRIERIFTD